MTPEMIEAGARAFCRYDSRYEGPNEIVQEIFEAILAASSIAEQIRAAIAEERAGCAGELEDQIATIKEVIGKLPSGSAMREMAKIRIESLEVAVEAIRAREAATVVREAVEGADERLVIGRAEYSAERQAEYNAELRARAVEEKHDTE